jgi:hypothetical protein
MLPDGRVVARSLPDQRDGMSNPATVRTAPWRKGLDRDGSLCVAALVAQGSIAAHLTFGRERLTGLDAPAAIGTRQRSGATPNSGARIWLV